MKFLRVILCICLFVSLLLTFLSGFYQYRLADIGTFQAYVVDEPYMDKAMAEIRSDIEFQCLYLGLPLDRVMPLIDRGEVRALCEHDADNFQRKLILGEAEEPLRFNPKLLEEGIRKIYIEQKGTLTADNEEHITCPAPSWHRPFLRTRNA